MRPRELIGALVFALFLGMFVFMMNTISAPDATYELGNYVIIADLIIALLFITIAWGPLINGEPWRGAMPFGVASWVGIPLGVALFVFLYVSGLGEILLHVNEILSPAIAITVAAAILAGATLLDRLSPHPPAAGQGDESHGHGDSQH